MRDIKICIYNDNELLNEVFVNDEETRRVSCHTIMVDKTTVFNIGGKESYNLKMSAEIPTKEAGMLKNGLILKLKYNDEKNKTKYFEIFNGKIEEDNENEK